VIGVSVAAVTEGWIAKAIAADPDAAALHCSMLAKGQLVICPVTSVRQNSQALASGVIIAAKAIAASKAAAGALVAFKNSFIMFAGSFWFGFRPQAEIEIAVSTQRSYQSTINQF
jgi:hypothetical protein